LKTVGILGANVTPVGHGDAAGNSGVIPPSMGPQLPITARDALPVAATRAELLDVRESTAVAEAQRLVANAALLLISSHCSPVSS